MIRTFYCLFFVVLLSACSNTNSTPNRVANKVGQKVETATDRTETSIELGADKLNRKVRHLGEVLEGNE
ncbi:MAG: hypothetical protein ABI615_02150 [Chthoniobacterales bacterium]